MPNAMIIFFLLIGFLSLSGAVFDWDWFMASRRAALVIRFFGRTGARVFYGAIGLFLVSLALAGAFGFMG